MSDQPNHRLSSNYPPQHSSAYPSLQYPPSYPVHQYSAQQPGTHQYSTQQPTSHQYTTQQPATHQYTAQQSDHLYTSQPPTIHQYPGQQSSAYPYTSQQPSTHQYTAQQSSVHSYISQQLPTGQYTAQQSSAHPYTSQPPITQSPIKSQESPFDINIQIKPEPIDYESGGELENQEEIVNSEFPEYLSHTTPWDNIEEPRNNNISLLPPSSYQAGANYLYNHLPTSNILEPQIKLEIGPDQYLNCKHRRRRFEVPEIIDLANSPPPLGESTPDESHVIKSESPFPSYVSNKSILQNYISNMMKHSESESTGTSQPTIVTLKPVVDVAEGDLEIDVEMLSEGGVGIQNRTQANISDSLNCTRGNAPESSNCETNLSRQGIDNTLVVKVVHQNRTEDLPSQDVRMGSSFDDTGTNYLELGTSKTVGTVENKESPDTSVHIEPAVLSSLSPKNGSISVNMELPSLEETSKHSPLKELFIAEAESLAFCQEDALTSQTETPRDNLSPPPDSLDSVLRIPSKPPEFLFSEEFSKPTKTYSPVKNSCDALKSSTNTGTRESCVSGDSDGPPVLLPEVPLTSSSNEEVQVAETLVRLGNQTELSLKENGIESLQSFSDSFPYKSSLGDLTKEAKQSSRDTSNQDRLKETVNKDPSFEEDLNMLLNETVEDKHTSIKDFSKEVENNLTNSNQQQATHSSLNEIDTTQTGEITPIKNNRNFVNFENLQQCKPSTSSENMTSEKVSSKRDISPDLTLSSKCAKKNKKGKKEEDSNNKTKNNRQKDKSKEKDVNNVPTLTMVTRSSSLRAQTTSEDVTLTPHGNENDGIYLLHPRPNRKGYLFCPQKPIISCLLPESMVLTLREKSDGKNGTSQTNRPTGRNNKSMAQTSDLDGKLREEVYLRFKGAPNSLRTSDFKIGYLDIKGYEELGYNIRRISSKTFNCPNFDFTFDLVSTQQAEHLLKTAEFSKPPSEVPPAGQKDSQSNLPSEMQDTKHYITYFWAAKPVEFGEDVSSASLPSEGPFTNFIGISDLAVIDIMRLIITKNSHAFASAGTASKDLNAACVPLSGEKNGERTQLGSFPPDAGREREHSRHGFNQRIDPGNSVRITQQQHSEVTGPNAGYNSRDINYLSNAARPHVPQNSHLETPYHIPPPISAPSDNAVINSNPPVHRAQLYSNVHPHSFSNASSDYLPPADNVPGNEYNPHVPQIHSFSNVYPHNFPNSSSNYIPPMTVNNAPKEGNNPHVHYGQMYSSNVFPNNFPNPGPNHLPPITSDNVPSNGNNSYEQRDHFSSRVYPQRLHNTSGDFIPPEPAPFNYGSPSAQSDRGSNMNQYRNANPVYRNLTPPPRHPNMYRQSTPGQQNPQRYPNPMGHPLCQPKDFHMNAPAYNTNNHQFQREQYQEPSNEFSQQLHHSPIVSPHNGVSARRNLAAPNEFEHPSTSTPQNYSLGVPREQRIVNYDLTVNHHNNRYRPYTNESSIPYRTLLSTSGGNMIRGPGPYGSPNYEMSPSGFSRMTTDTLGLRPQGEQPYGPTPPATVPSSPYTPGESADTQLQAEVEDAVVCKDAARLGLLAARARAVGDGVSTRRAEAHLAFLRRNLAAVETLIAAEAFPERYLQEMQTLWFSCRFQREYPTRALPKTFAAAFRQRHPLPETLQSVIYRILAAAFAENPFPPPKERLHLAERIGFTSKQVDTWFKNQRKNLNILPLVLTI